MSEDFLPADLLKDLTLDVLKETRLGGKLRQASEAIEKIQANLYALRHTDDSKELLSLKIGTVLTLSLAGKMLAGKSVRSLTTDDWKEIAAAVSDLAVLPAGRSYSSWVFSLYEDYIRASASVLNSESDSAAIEALADELAGKSTALAAGTLPESRYIEDCLWISLEAMVKLLVSFKAQLMGEEYATFVRAVSAYSFEYLRYSLYSREDALLDRYLQEQQALDEELERDFKAYMDELGKRMDEFNRLVAGAFDSDFRTALKNSAGVARAAGVPEEEILASVVDIDDFFLS